MSLSMRLCPSTPYALALVMVAMSSSLLGGQTPAIPSLAPQPVTSGARIAQATFVAAPSFALKDVPTSAVATDLDGDGKLDLIVASAASAKVSVYLGLGKGKFSTPVDYMVGGHPTAIIAVDIDGDGTKDIVTANGADGTVSVLLTLAGGKLAASQTYTVGSDATFLAAGDLNGDGKQDLAVASASGRGLAILLNNGQKGLEKPLIQGLRAIPSALALGDFDGDGHVDVIVANADGSVEVLAGAGDGSVKPSASLQVASSGLSSIVTGHFSRTGRLDLAVTESNGRTLTTLLNQGDGTFLKGASYKVGNHPASTVAVDVNGDGLADLISLNQGSNTLSVLLGKQDGSFQQASDLTVGDGPVALSVGDFHGGGYAGLAVINASSRNVNIIAGKGDGTFGASPSYSGDVSPRAIASGDLNGDGIPDIVVANFCGSDAQCGGEAGSLSVYLGAKAGGYTLASTHVTGSGPVSVALADLNGDGILDVVALNRSEKSLSVMLGIGDGTLQPSTTTSLVGSPIALMARDFDGDGKLDLAIVSDCGTTNCSQRGAVSTYFGLGDGSFRFGSTATVGFSPASIAAGDLNGDGVLDLVVANACGKDASCNSGGTASVLIGAQSGTFTSLPDIALSKNPSSIALRANPGSKSLDLVVSNETDNTVAVLPGNGDATFKTASLYAVGASPRSLVIADLNGDGRPDVAVANAKDSTVSVLYGQADGSLVAGDVYPVAAGPEALTAVASIVGSAASLVTANGNTSSALHGSEITALTNITPSVAIATTLTLSSAPASSNVNQAVTFTAVVTPVVAGSGNVPQGSVAFVDSVSGTTLCTVTLASDGTVPPCIYSSFAAGTYLVNANYSSADANFLPSSNSTTQTVSMTGTTTTVSASPSPSLLNQQVTFNAVVTPATTGPVIPSGSVTFSDSVSGLLCTNTLTPSGAVPSCSTSALAVGAHTITATYNGDSNFTTSSSTVNETVSLPTTLSLMAAPSASVINQQVAFTATINYSASSLVPQGSVTFTDTSSGAVLCTQVVAADGSVPACSVTLTTPITHAITVSYTSSDTNFGSSSGSITQVVTAGTTTLAVSASAEPSSVNQSVSFTAVITPGIAGPVTPYGAVRFTDTLTGAVLCNIGVNLDGTIAPCTTTFPNAVIHPILASYTTSDANFQNSQITDNHSVVATPVTIAVTSSPATSTVNQSAIFTAVITPRYSGTTKPQGSIVFSDTLTNTTLCTVAVAADGSVPTCTSTFLTAANHPVLANFTPSDTNFVATSGTDTQAVGATSTTTSVTTSLTPSSVNQSVTFNAVVTSTIAGATKPQGTVNFTDSISGQILCAQVLNAAGAVPACVTTALGAGTHTITAAFVPSDANFSQSSGTVTQVVITTATTTTVTSSLNPASVNQTVSLTATVTPATASTTKPQGTVTFIDTLTSTVLCTTTLDASGAVAPCVAAFGTAATHGVTATYASADTNFSGSSGRVNQVVTTTATTLAVSSTPSTSTVNQSVSFTAVITPGYMANAKPQGTVTFTDTLASRLLCTQSVAVDGTVAPCVTSFPTAGTHPVVALFMSVDSNFSGSSATDNQVVTAATTTTALTSSPSPSSVNQQVVFTTVITSTLTGTAKPQGTVVLTDTLTNIVLCTVTVAADGTVPTCTSVLTSTGTHIVTAVYTSTNNNFAGSTGADSQVVNPTPTSLTLTSSATSPSINTPVTLTAKVAPMIDASFTGNAIPQGTVTFTDTAASAALCTGVALAANGTATCVKAFTSAGTHTITAVFTPSNTSFAAATGTLAQVVVTGSTTTTVTSSLSTSQVDQAVVFTPVVSAVIPGGAKPQGTLTLVDTFSNATICTMTLAADGSLQPCSATLLQAGTHVITASFVTSDSNFIGSTGNVSQVVSATATTLSIAPSITASAVDQPVSITITLTPALAGGTLPKGIVVLTDNPGGTAICSQNVAADGSVPVCAVSFLTQGVHTITASYASSDANFAKATSSPVSITVTAAPTTVTVSSVSPSPASVNQTVNFTALVTPAFSAVGLTAPTGSVVFSYGTTSICTAPLKADGTATCATLLGAAGTYPVSATYLPAPTDNNFIRSTSTSSFSEVVSPAGTTLALTSASPTSVATMSVTYTATLGIVAPALAGSIPVAGNITFTAGGGGVLASNCATAISPITPGTAYTCTVTFPTGVGSPYAVTATFNPANGNFTTSSASAVQAVQDFSVQFVTGAVGSTTPYAGPLNITQTYTNLSDPFNPVASLATVTTASNGFNQGLVYTCTIPGASGLTCATTSAAGSALQSVLFTASASATPGTYLATLTATDSITPTLVHTATLTVQVGSLIQTTLTPGVTGTISVPFNVPTPQDTFTFACAKITSGGIASTLISCSPSVTSGSLAAGSASFIISANPQTSMSAPGSPVVPSSRIFNATFLCVPLFALAGCLRRRKLDARAFMRFLAALTVLVGALQTTGCGGGFATPPANLSKSSGSYLVQVTATDTRTKAVYYAVIPVVVQSAN